VPYNNNGLNAAANGIAAAGTYISAHTADPGSTGTSEVAGGSYARQQTTWGTASAGERVGSQVVIPIPAGTSVTHWGIWSAVTTGTFLGGFALGATETFGAAGTLNHTPTIDANAS
jgi:hypothetical protein